MTTLPLTVKGLRPLSDDDGYVYTVGPKAWCHDAAPAIAEIHVCDVEDVLFQVEFAPAILGGGFRVHYTIERA